MRSLILIWFLMLSSAVYAEIYECIEKDGNKLFTDNLKTAKAKGCKAMNLGPPNTISAPAAKAQSQGKSAAAPTPSRSATGAGCRSSSWPPTGDIGTP